MTIRISHRIFLVVLCGLAWLATPIVGARAQDAAFLSGIEDFPLMPGLRESLDITLVFDSAEGRYVEAYAFGEVTPLAVSHFYRHSLPQLGWWQDGINTYRREGEVLVIIASETSGDLTSVRFALSPEGAE